MSFLGLNSIGPAGPSLPAKSANFNGNATCIHGHDFVFCSLVLRSTQVLWLLGLRLHDTAMDHLTVVLYRT